MRLIVPFLTICLAACGVSTSGGGTRFDLAGIAPPFDFGSVDLGVTGTDLAISMDDLARPADMTGFVYPAGPYGVRVGDTIFNFSSKGYPLEPGKTTNQVGYHDIQLSDLARLPMCRCILISQDAVWAGPSNANMQTLAGNARNAGLCVLEVLLEGKNFGGAATQPDLQSWADNYSLDFPAVVASASTMTHLPLPMALPTLTTVSAPSMQIVAVTTGVSKSEIADALAACM